jgi:hypothetical protein
MINSIYPSPISHLMFCVTCYLLRSLASCLWICIWMLNKCDANCKMLWRDVCSHYQMITTFAILCDPFCTRFLIRVANCILPCAAAEHEHIFCHSSSELPGIDTNLLQNQTCICICIEKWNWDTSIMVSMNFRYLATLPGIVKLIALVRHIFLAHEN